MKTVLFTIIFFSFHAIAQQPELVLPVGHTQVIFSTQFTPDGKYILTCAYDNTARIWEATSGRLINTFENLRQGIGDVVNKNFFTHLSKDGNYLFALTTNGSLKKWGSLSGKLIYSLSDKQNEPPVSRIMYSYNDSFIITQSIKTTQLYQRNVITEMRDGKNGRVLYLIEKKDQPGSNTNIEFSPSQNVFLDVQGNSLYIRNALDGKMLFKQESLDNFNNAFFTAGGNYVAIYPQRSNTLRLWNVKDGSMTEIKVSGHVHFSADDRILAALNSPFAETRDLSSGKVLAVIKAGDLYLNEQLNLSENGKYIFLSTAHPFIKGEEAVDSSTTIWDTETGNKLFILKGNEPGIRAVLFSQDDKYIYTISDFSVKIWQRENGGLIKTADFNTRIQDYSFSPDCNSIVISYGTESRILSPLYDYEVTLRGHSHPVVEAAFSVKGSELVTVSNEKNVKFWDLSTGKISRVFNDQNSITSAKFTTLNNHVFLHTDSSVIIASPETGETIFTLKHNDRIRAMNCSENKNYLVTSTSSSAFIWNGATGELVNKIIDDYAINDAGITNNGEFVWTLNQADNWSSIAVWNVATSRMVYRKVQNGSIVTQCQLSKDGKYLLAIAENDAMNLYELRSGELVKEFNKGYQSERGITYMSTQTYQNLWHSNFDHFSPDGKYILLKTGMSNEAMLWDMQTFTRLDDLKGNEGILNAAAFIPNTNFIITSARDNTIRVWELKNKHATVIKSISGNGFVIAPDGSRLVTVNTAQLTLYELPSLKELYRFLAVDDNDYFIQLPRKMIYAATRNAVKKLSFRLNDQVYSFDQFDLQYNRPHEVLKALGNPDTSLLRLYEKAWQKRIHRSGFTEKSFTDQLHLPTLSLLNRNQILPVVASQEIEVYFDATDKLYQLNRYYVYINDVPINGINGKHFQGQYGQSIHQKIRIDLNAGFNKVQISCMNEKGVESLKETFFILYQPLEKPPSPNTYFIGIGVSDYKDSSMNLHYAAKDIRDLGVELERKIPFNYKTDTLIDGNATRKNILALKNILEQTAIEDKVIISVSGHGLLDENLDFYFATYDMNFKKPSEKGLLYEDLENLMDNIPARKKLLLIDACHSGELDKIAGSDKNAETSKNNNDKNLIEFSKGTELENTGTIGLQNSFELMKELFTDISRSNGTVVISAAGGKEYAYEDNKYSNGVFTYCIKKALSGNVMTGSDKAGISVNELKEYVSKKVEELTNGKQRPTTRKENLEFDWRLW